MLLGRDNPHLLSRSFTTTRWNWVARTPPAELASIEGLAVGVKVMSVGPPLPAILRSMCVSPSVNFRRFDQRTS